jgi:hypothetical protein
MINVSYSVGDFTGRSIGRLRNSYNRTFMTISISARLIFVASSFTIAFSAASFWNNSFVIMLNTFLIALTGGFLGVAGGNSVPGRLDMHEKEFGGFVLGIMINIGIAMGSLISAVGLVHLF